jgi:hypothetical protein
VAQGDVKVVVGFLWYIGRRRVCGEMGEEEIGGSGFYRWRGEGLMDEGCVVVIYDGAEVVAARNIVERENCRREEK